MRVNKPRNEPVARVSMAVTKLDRLLFRRLGWSLTPLHAKLLRVVARTLSDELKQDVTMADILHHGERGATYTATYHRIRQLAAAGVLEIRRIAGAAQTKGQPSRAIRLSEIGIDLLNQSRLEAVKDSKVRRQDSSKQDTQA